MNIWHARGKLTEKSLKRVGQNNLPLFKAVLEITETWSGKEKILRAPVKAWREIALSLMNLVDGAEVVVWGRIDVNDKGYCDPPTIYAAIPLEPADYEETNPAGAPF